MNTRPCSVVAKGRHRRGDRSLRPVPGTSPLKSWQEGTGHGDESHEQFTWSVLRNKLQGLVPKIQTGLNLWGLSQGPKLVPVTSFSSKTGQFTRCDLSPQLVAATSRLIPSCVPTLILPVWHPHVAETNHVIGIVFAIYVSRRNICAMK